MKTLKIFFYTLLLTSSVSFAQYNNGYNNGSRYGAAERGIGGDNTREKAPTPEEIEKNRNERVDSFMAKLKTALTLDELQVIAIKNEFISNSKSIDIIMKKEDDQETKATEIKALTDKTEVVIKSYLNKDQKEKYAAFIEALKENKKEKKGKKKDLDKEQEKPTKE